MRVKDGSPERAEQDSIGRQLLRPFRAVRICELQTQGVADWAGLLLAPSGRKELVLLVLYLVVESSIEDGEEEDEDSGPPFWTKEQSNNRITMQRFKNSRSAAALSLNAMLSCWHEKRHGLV